MRNCLFLISLALSSAACTQSPAFTEVQDDAPSVSASASAEAVSSGGDTPAKVAFEDDARDGDAVREFAYSWPSEVSAIPELANLLRSERDEALAEQKAEWDRSRAEFAGEDCVSCVGRGYEVTWKVAADIPGWLSLTRDLYLYTGGAHGMSGRTSLVWDRANSVGIDGSELFKSAVALENALGAKLCATLNKEREERRGSPVDPQSDAIFEDCPSLDEASIFVGSSDGKHFDRIGVYFGPYVAGPYAEGSYELDFPVSASVLDAVKPAYAKAFRVRN